MNRTSRKPSSQGALVPGAAVPDASHEGTRATGTKASGSPLRGSVGAELTGSQGPDRPQGMVNPEHKRRKGLDRSKDYVRARYPKDRSKLIVDHGFNVSSIITEALDKVYLELVTKKPVKSR